MALLKISAALIAAVGATSENDFDAAFTKTITDLRASAKTVADENSKLTGSVTTLTEANTKLTETVNGQAKEITDLKAKLGDPSTMTEAKIRDLASIAGNKAATDILGEVGAGTPAAVPGATAGTVAGKEVAKKDFVAIVADNIAAGKSKPDAVMAAVKSNPAEHAEWLKVGGKL